MLTAEKTPLLSKQSLFDARTNGYHVYRIPGLLVTKRGVVIATTEARCTDGHDYDNIDLLYRRSLDGGLTWEARQVLASHTNFGPGPMHNLSLLCDRDTGIVHAVFCYDYARVFHVTSSDDGKTFSPPVEITESVAALRKVYPWATVGTGPGHGLQLQNGRFVIPTWFADGSGREMGAGKRGHRPSCVSSIYSDDRGKTWKCGELIANDGPRFKNPSETVAVELTDGRVLFNLRTESKEHRRLIAISPDGATQWSDPHFDAALLEPVCMGNILRLSGIGDQKRSRMLFVNPDNLESAANANWSGVKVGDRKNLTLQVSYDDCRSWTVKKSLETGASGYSDLQMLADGTILCLYECGAAQGSSWPDQHLILARFNLEWLTNGQDSLND